ncbi:MAG TPA: glutamate--tRNA ligase [Vicinamibacterales bacterium]|nr:glutamate--tRNA ligase [Vicinamibacterales bacterium]
MPPRLRFAPSPTGYLHVGGARTALFNWLLARRTGGTFVLRIEDTDAERSSDEMVTGILDGLRWLGLDWDEGPEKDGPHAPYFQSQRYERHRAAADRLLESGHAYRCYCTPDRLREERERAEQRGEAWQYDRACLKLSADDRRSREASGAPYAVRFLVREGHTSFIDAVHGRIEFDTAHVEDFVILRSDRHPTYHLSVVVDDVDMGITNVIRGDDHISNTPKHVLLFEALGAAVPSFAHVPLILGSDKKRLSKRHGATSVMEYARQGYLPDAMVNFLALLGWSPGDDRQVMTREELIAAFSLDGISGGNAVFDTDKLDWMNAQYVARMSVEELAAHARTVLEEAGLTGSPIVHDTLRFHRLLELLRPRVKRLGDFVEQGRPLLAPAVEYDPAAIEKNFSSGDMAEHLAALAQALERLSPFDESHVEAVVRGTATDRAIKAGPLIHAVRVALTGRTASPGLFEMMALLGRDETTARLRALLAFLAARS